MKKLLQNQKKAKVITKELHISVCLIFTIIISYLMPSPVLGSSYAEPPTERFVIDREGEIILPYSNRHRIIYLGSGLYCVYSGYFGENPSFYNMHGKLIDGIKVGSDEYIDHISRIPGTPEDFENPTSNLIVYCQNGEKTEVYDFKGKKISAPIYPRFLEFQPPQPSDTPNPSVLEKLSFEKGYSPEHYWGDWFGKAPVGQFLYAYRPKTFDKAAWIRNGEYEMISRHQFFYLFLKENDLIGMNHTELLELLGPPQKTDKNSIFYTDHKESIGKQLNNIQIRFDKNDRVEAWRSVFDCADPKASIKHFEHSWETRNMTPGPEHHGRIGALVPKYPDRESPNQQPITNQQ